MDRKPKGRGSVIHVVHPTGNQFVRALLSGLESRAARFQYWTTVATGTNGLSGCLPGRIRSLWEKRSYPVPKDKIRTRPLREWVRLAAPALGLECLTHHESGWASADAVYQDLDRFVAKQLLSHRSSNGGASWVYAYEDGALECLEAASRAGMRRAYELPIAYWETSRRLLEEEAARLPHWASTLVGPDDSPVKLERKTRELEMAEVIVVPSRFVERSLPDWITDSQRVVVAEFGSPAGGAVTIAANRETRNQRLRVLFAGSMTQRKGLADVFEAIRLLNRRDVELVVMGSPLAPMEFYRGQGVAFSYEPPRPHRDVLQLMRSCDVLVLPSIVEGRALVQQEALVCGLPIIATANAGGEDLLIEGNTGFAVPVRSPQSIADRIAWLADHRGHLETCMRPACQAKAAEYSWTRYAETILHALEIGPN